MAWVIGPCGSRGEVEACNGMDGADGGGDRGGAAQGCGGVGDGPHVEAKIFTPHWHPGSCLITAITPCSATTTLWNVGSSTPYTGLISSSFNPIVQLHQV